MKFWNDISNNEQVERWENMIRVLQSLSPHERRKHWDMSQWGQKTDCGTVACAAGHCGLDPWFRRRGFQLNFRPFRYFDANNPKYHDDIGDPKEFFGSDGADYIFYTDGTVTEVIKRVKNYIKQLKIEHAAKVE